MPLMSKNQPPPAKEHNDNGRYPKYGFHVSAMDFCLYRDHIRVISVILP